MTDKRDRQRDGSLPAQRDAEMPARSSSDAAAAPYATHPQFSLAAPAPEYLSLTYTLPYHLVVRADEIARASYRSQSEVLAEALRLYVRIWKARRKHARISTVDGFSYREVETAEALLEEEVDFDEVVENGNGHGNGSDHGGRHAVNGQRQPTASDQEMPAQEAQARTEPSTASRETETARPSEPSREHHEQPETDRSPRTESRDADHAVEKPSDAATPAPGRQVDAGAGGDAGGSTSDAADAEARDRDETGTADASEPATASASAPITTGETSAAPVAVQESPAVASDADQKDIDEDLEELHEIADPAASVRQELETVSSEPLHGLRLQRVLEKIVTRIDVKDHSPEDHSATVSEMARKLGRIRGLKGKELLHIQLAGLVHDIGKASIPDHILAKRRPSPEEMAMIRKYPEFGAELLRIVPSLEPIARLVASHQERWNGNGYPDGMQGSDIPVESQIVALCDVYQVLIHDRHYRPAYTEERALQIIRQNVGTLWNPEIARAFLKLITNGDEEAE